MPRKATGRERRRFGRIKLDHLKLCHDISEGGFYIRTDRPRRLGSLVNFEIKLEENKPPIRGRGRVVRIIHQAGAVGSDPPGMAIEFVEIEPADRERIRQVVTKLQSSAGTGSGEASEPSLV
jgi:uncharacterized protein (TIGR02266 family)